MRSGLLLLPVVITLAATRPALGEDTTACFEAIGALNDGRLTEAVDHYTRCIEDGDLSDSNLIVAYNDRGNAFGRLSLFDAALADFNRVIALEPEDADAYYNRGLTHKKAHQLNAAVDDYTRAIKLNPRYAKAYNNRGSIYGRRGLFNKAITDFSQAIALNGANASAYYNRGLAYYSLGTYKRAIEDLEKAIELNPEYRKAFESLAWLRATCPVDSLRDGVMAIALAKKARLLAPEGTPTLFDTMAAAYAAAGRFEEAVRYQELAIDYAPETGGFEARLDLYRGGSQYLEQETSNRFLDS